MAAKIFYQEDCDLSLLDGKNCDYWIRQPGTCSCVKLKKNLVVMLSLVFMKEVNPGKKAEKQGIKSLYSSRSCKTG